ncbi:MAG: FAD-dependent oxidoreductase [Candidatus Omnitrophota bacterium]|nr:FAD-dependent oxidoreductase [Candidatus Omnitrophota bacterium]MBU1928799.1 FAD-dependent oxidoreductase [Candidatus Omnitrophota bacterium]MBU2034258.1 FAD-dependent oxidoreductase [Candidatus Omnitrophota bacterium]MBU2221674.1 FAD-dependent oxidoreductase [Candidatus Omnitrophota bacterium]MBU2258485.1 FAD-dependent oxidoreductase [Candidatus Omnitrophota bacterium]
MNKKVDILIIGAGPAGVVSAVTARKYYPAKSIMVMKDIADGVIPCGIPYMFASLSNPEENKLGMASLEKNNIEVVIDTAVSINRKDKTVDSASKTQYSYEKLVLAIGSTPLILPIKGVDKQGVYPINKEMGYLKNVIEQIKRCKNVLVIGGGFIGVEFADELSKLKGINVTLVEMLPCLMANSFDPEFSQMAELRLKEKGVNVLTNNRVEEIIGQDKVEKVRFSDGKEMPIEGVILGVGSKPNVKLAVDAGLELGSCKGILTDEYMRTSVDSDIFAIGDCACKRDFYTRKSISVMLASTATAEARIAGANLYQIKVIRENKGTIAIYSTYIDGLVLGSAGLTEKTAREESFEIIVCSIDGVDKHPASLPGAHKGKIKLIFSKQSGIILGGQVSCGMSCAQMINIIGIAIQKRMSATELETLQVATHPYLTSAPTMYPIILAAQDVYGKI